MASTYSNLKIQLMTAGENNTTWGNVTNINLGTAIEEAITGSANVTFASSDVTLTLTDTNATQTARNLRLNLTGTSGGARNLIVPAIEKVYIINNGVADTVTVKNATGTGIAVPAGKTMWVFNDGTNVVDVLTHLTSLTLATALPVAQGGTGATTAAAARANLGAGTGNGTVTSVAVSGSTTGLTFSGGPITTSGTITMGGTLTVGNGGTGFTSFTNGQLLIGNSLDGGLAKATLTAGTNISITNGNGTITIASTAGNGTVTSVSGTGSTNGLSLSGTVTTSGNLTLSGSVTSVASGATIDGVVIGYRNIPRSTTTTTAVVGDVGKCIAATAGITIPNSTFAAGDALSIYNNSASSITITQGSGLTLRQVGTATTGNRTLAAYGYCTIWFNSASEAVIMGGGLS